MRLPIGDPDKLRAVMQKAAGHKYKSRKPDGKGGWLYDYGDGYGKSKPKREKAGTLAMATKAWKRALAAEGVDLSDEEAADYTQSLLGGLSRWVMNTYKQGDRKQIAKMADDAKAHLQERGALSKPQATRVYREMRNAAIMATGKWEHDKATAIVGSSDWSKDYMAVQATYRESKKSRSRVEVKNGPFTANEARKLYNAGIKLLKKSDDGLVKARSGGWSAVPNSKHGGQRKRSGKGYSYRYPDGKGGWQAGVGRRQPQYGPKRASGIKDRLVDHKVRRFEASVKRNEQERKDAGAKKLKATLDRIGAQEPAPGKTPPLDFGVVQARAKDMATVSIKGAIEGLLEALDSADKMDRSTGETRGGKYRDEIGVYRQELAKRKEDPKRGVKKRLPIASTGAKAVKLREAGDHAGLRGLYDKVNAARWSDADNVYYERQMLGQVGAEADRQRKNVTYAKHLDGLLSEIRLYAKDIEHLAARKSMNYTVPRRRFVVLRKGAGWSAIPTGKKGGQRQPDGKGGWRYRYPDGKGGYSSSPSKGKPKRKSPSGQSALDFGGGGETPTPRGGRIKPAFQPVAKEAAPREELPQPKVKTTIEIDTGDAEAQAKKLLEGMKPLPEPPKPVGGLMRVELPGDKSLFINQAPEPLKEGAMSKEGYAAGDGPYKEGDVLHPDHKDEASAYVIDDYPYGRSRTQMRVWIETDKKGAQRIVRQTQNPKTDRWNNPKKSTYSDGLVAKFDEKGHIGSLGISVAYRSDGQVTEFLKKYGGHMDPRKISMAAAAAAYDAAGEAGMGHQEKLKAAHDMMEKLSPKGEDKPKKKASPRTRYNEALTHENDPAGYSKQLTSDVKKVLKNELGVTSIKQGYKGSGSKSNHKQLWVRFANGQGIDLFLEGNTVILGGVQRSGFGKVDATGRSSYEVAAEIADKLKSISQEGQDSRAGEWG